MVRDQARIAVLVSGGGTNLQALLDAERSGVLTSGKIVLVVSNKPGVYALERAARAGVRAEVRTKKALGGQEGFEQALNALLSEEKVDLIILAGFLSILTEAFTSRWPDRILNIHPALIPSFCGKGFYGLKVHEEALKRGVKVTGATVHFVNEIPDGGEILLQKAVDILPGDTPEVLQKRVMEQAEWVLLPKAAELVSERIVSARACRDGKPCEAPADGQKGREMDIYKIKTIEESILGNPYVGRGILLGKTPDGKKAVSAYFIMGRSENSRNRVFEERDGEIFTKAFDESKVKDPSLIIYAAVRQYGNRLIVTNGNQTDTVYDGLAEGKSFEESLRTRCFEPDGPNFTPRISGMMTFEDGGVSYDMSILKSIDAEGSDCARYTFSYPSKAGLGHFIHTYVTDGNPIPTFQGEPERILTCDCIDEMTERIWNALDADNKISLYVRYTDLASLAAETRIINRNERN
ncbi:MAG: phosphoribosylglycinamide formyltransferase [Lachnospiraceae bacterium]|nr:phosphoribosylglycinamide formyltransferase [Lachnospiraceae bacterium]